jgi:hypothetical protein
LPRHALSHTAPRTLHLSHCARHRAVEVHAYLRRLPVPLPRALRGQAVHHPPRARRQHHRARRHPHPRRGALQVDR